jgi:HEAT repeat protein
MKRGRLVTIGFLAALGIGGVLLMVVLPSRELSYQGLTLDEWLEDFDRGFYTASRSIWPRSPYPSDPDEAIRSMGQPAVDALLDRMTYEDPAWKLKLIALAQKQSVFKVSFKPAGARRGGAFSALCELGPSASNAVPRLVEWLSDQELEDEAELVLARIGRASVEPLRARLAHEDPKVRSQAAKVLGWIGPEAAPAVPQLLYSLSDTNRAGRSAVIRALGAIGEPRDEMEQRLIGLLHVPEGALDAAHGLVSMGTNSIPVLTRAMTNENAGVCWAGAVGVKFWQDHYRRPAANHKFSRMRWGQTIMLGGTVPQQQVTLLIGNLDDPDPRVRELSAAMLTGFPTESARIVPALEECLQDEDATVRTTVRRSLEQLPKPAPAESVITLDGAKPLPPPRARPPWLIPL